MGYSFIPDPQPAALVRMASTSWGKALKLARAMRRGDPKIVLVAGGGASVWLLSLIQPIIDRVLPRQEAVASIAWAILAAYLLKAHPEPNTDGAIMGAYLTAARWCLSHRKTTVLAAALFVVGSLALVPLLPKGFVPAADLGLVMVKLELPPGSALDDTIRAAAQARALVKPVADITGVFTAVGKSAAQGPLGEGGGKDVRLATLTIKLVHRSQRSRTQAGVEAEIRERLQTLPGARVSIGSGAPGEKLQVSLASEDPIALEAAARAVERDWRSLPGVGNVTSGASLQRPEIQIRPDFARAAEVSPDYPDIRFQHGRILERLDRLDEAIEEYRAALASQQGFIEARVAMGFALLEAGREEEAAEAFTRALEIKVREIRDPFEKGMRRLREGMADESREYLREAFYAAPDRFAHHFRNAIRFIKAGNHERAIEDLDEALAISPKFADLHNYRGITLCELGRVEEAIAAFRRSAALNPDYVEARLNLAFAQIRLGQFKEAEAQLETVLALDPAQTAAAVKLEELRTGRAAEARRAASRGGAR